MTPLRFATVGDNCIDEFPGAMMRSFVGGNAVNVAVQIRKLGHSVAYFGAVGPDGNGERIKRTLEANTVDCRYTKILDGTTARTVISVDEYGDRSIAFEDFGVCAKYAPSDAEIAMLLQMDHVHIGWLADGGKLRRLLSEAGVSVSQDISVNADPGDIEVAGLSIAFASAQLSQDSAIEIAERILGDGAGIAVVMRGALGSIAKGQYDFAEAGIEPVTVVDTTGAGDSFIAGFLSGYLVGEISLPD